MSRPASVVEPDDGDDHQGNRPGIQHGRIRFDGAAPRSSPPSWPTDRSHRTADARVIRRGKSLCFCDVDVTGADGGLVAKGIVTYKLG